MKGRTPVLPCPSISVLQPSSTPSAGASLPTCLPTPQPIRQSQQHPSRPPSQPQRPPWGERWPPFTGGCDTRYRAVLVGFSVFPGTGWEPGALGANDSRARHPRWLHGCPVLRKLCWAQASHSPLEISVITFRDPSSNTHSAPCKARNTHSREEPRTRLSEASSSGGASSSDSPGPSPAGPSVG